MNVEVEKITPELAKKYLANNKINRGLNKNSVAKYATSMQEGRWKLNGEPIQFNCDGTLINGQHRLQACVRADTSFDTLVARESGIEVINDDFIWSRKSKMVLSTSA